MSSTLNTHFYVFCRIPHYNHKYLTAWYQGGKSRQLHRLLRYFVLRVQLNLDILENNELVVRTRSEYSLPEIPFRKIMWMIVNKHDF